VDGLVTAFGLEVRDLTADACVAASQFLTAVLRRSLEPGQYLSATYTGILAQHSAHSSAGKPGTCFDNAAAESFFATLKKELLHRATWPTRQHARTAIFTYIESFYNWQRRHSTLDYRSPADFEADHFAATLAA
jgi:transposase InsO family protein